MTRQAFMTFSIGTPSGPSCAQVIGIAETGVRSDQFLADARDMEHMNLAVEFAHATQDR